MIGDLLALMQAVGSLTGALVGFTWEARGVSEDGRR